MNLNQVLEEKRVQYARHDKSSAAYSCLLPLRFPIQSISIQFSVYLVVNFICVANNHREYMHINVFILTYRLSQCIDRYVRNLHCAKCCYSSVEKTSEQTPCCFFVSVYGLATLRMLRRSLFLATPMASSTTKMRNQNKVDWGTTRRVVTRTRVSGCSLLAPMISCMLPICVRVVANNKRLALVATTNARIRKLKMRRRQNIYANRHPDSQFYSQYCLMQLQSERYANH